MKTVSKDECDTSEKDESDAQPRELIGHGRNIFMGYLNKESDTKEVITSDNWLSLGDTGYIDEEGFVVLTEYKPDLVHLSTGESVNPTVIEDKVRKELQCISHCVLVGEGRDKLGMLLTLDAALDIESGIPTNILSPSCKKWFQATRFDVSTIADVTQSIEEAGMGHVIQVTKHT